MQGTPDPVRWAAEACARYGLDPIGARLIRHYSNAVVLLPREGAVARVAIGPHDSEQIRRSQAITRWLADKHGFRTVVPLDDLDVVRLSESVTVSLWEYYPQPSQPPRYSSEDLAGLLRTLHSLPATTIQLEEWRPLSSLEDALQDDATTSTLLAGERTWLVDQLHAIREILEEQSWELGVGLVHGDAWAGNLLMSPDGVALGDWDRVAVGPREIDLVPTWHARRRYGRDQKWIDTFVAKYGYDLAQNEAYPALMVARDLAQLPGPLRRAPHSSAHAAALRQRLGCLMAGDTASHWIAL